MDGREGARLVHEIYEAAQAPGGWAETLGAMGRTFGLDGWNLLRCRPGDVQVVAAGGERVSAQAPARYMDYYAAIDPRAIKLLQGEPLQMMLTQREFSAGFVANSEFYQDFLLPEGLLYSLGLNAHRAADHQYLVGLHRGPERGAFDDASEALMKRLAPHLQRAFRLMDEIELQRERAAQAFSATDASPMAVLVLDWAARVRDCNRHAEALLRSGQVIRLREGVLRCTSNQAQGLWSRAIDQCAQGPGPVSLLLRGDGEEAVRYSVTLMRSLGHSAGAWPGVRMASAGSLLCLVTPLGRRRLASAAQLIDTFGFTPAEARLARALAAGQSVEGYSQQHALKISTVRTHLRALLAKTGAVKQAGLLQLLATLPVVRGAPS